MDDELLVAAAVNNALWCDAVCRAHVVSTSFGTDAWTALTVAPRLYPNVVTLSVDGREEQLRRVAELRASLVPSGWGVKDSFDVLDLAPQGFRPALHGRWAALHNDEPGPFDGVSRFQVSRVDTQEALWEWESAWNIAHPEDERAGSLVFPLSLLEDPDISFLSVWDGSELVAGLVANHGAGVVGVSNLFMTDRHGPRAVWPCLAQVRAMWPEPPLVGYGPDRPTMLGRLGFRHLGDLTVWRLVDDGAAQGPCPSRPA